MLITLNSKFQILITFYPTFGFRIFFVDIIQLVNLYNNSYSDSGYVNQLRPYRGLKNSYFLRSQVLITFFTTFGFRNVFLYVTHLVDLYNTGFSEFGYVNHLRPKNRKSKTLPICLIFFPILLAL